MDFTRSIHRCLVLIAISGVDVALATTASQILLSSSAHLNHSSQSRLTVNASHTSKHLDYSSLSQLTTNASRSQFPMTAAASITSDPPDTERDCILGDPHCSWTGVTTTYAGPTAALHLNDQCLLWNGTCSGNHTQALLEFFGGSDVTDGGAMSLLEENTCFRNSSINCTNFEPAPVLSDFSIIKDWMRSPQCLSSSSEWARLQGEAPATASGGDTCCDTCYISAKNVDVYYWPESGSDTSCLSIVGNVTTPSLDGATTASDGVYWGCTARDGKFVQTATLSSIGPITFKQSLFNPWVSQPCGSISPNTQDTNFQSVHNRDLPHRFHARGHSLVLPPNITQNDGLRASTVVTAGFTL